jgi:hypothetical protein
MDDESKVAAPTALLVPQAHAPGERHATPLPEIDEGQFRRILLHSFADEPLEDGVRHPGEVVLRQALTAIPDAAPQWTARLYHETESTRPALAADLLRCLGRLSPAVAGEMGWSLVREAIGHPAAEVREAAVRALEEWGGGEALALLRARLAVEPLGWLRRYITLVIADLT